MKFLCLIYMNEEERDAIPAEQWEPLMQEGFDVGDELRARGVFLGGNALQPVRNRGHAPEKSGASGRSPTVRSPRPKSNWPGTC
jgi:hypothetical protein